MLVLKVGFIEHAAKSVLISNRLPLSYPYIIGGGVLLAAGHCWSRHHVSHANASHMMRCDIYIDI